jgi:hypothetical protein
MSPSRLFRTLVCRAPLVIGTAVVVASIVLLASFGTPTSYDAHALARLGPLPADATAGARAPSSPERAQALASDRVLRAVTDELRLAADPSVRALRERRGDTAAASGPAAPALLGVELATFLKRRMLRRACRRAARQSAERRCRLGKRYGRLQICKQAFPNSIWGALSRRYPFHD